jgi:hypothetical protein
MATFKKGLDSIAPDIPWSTSGPWGSQTKLNYKVLGVKAMEPYTAADADSTAKCIDDCVTSHTPTGFAPDVRSAKLDKEMDARFAPEPSGKAHDLYGNLCNEAPRKTADDRQYKAKSAVVTDQFGTPTKYTAPVRPYEPKFDSFVNTFGTPAGSTGSPEYTGEPGGVVLTPSGIGEQVIDLSRRVASLDQWSHNAVNLIMKMESRIDRLTDHVNREIGVAQDVPLHSRLGDAGLDSKVPVGLALDEAFRRINALESRPVEHPEWFTGVDQFIGRVDKELEEHRRELRRIVHGPGPSPAPLTEKEVARLIVTFAAGMSSFGVVIDLLATAENINNYITGKR